MEINKKIWILRIAYILMLVLMFIIPLFSLSGYYIIRNTVNELGSQSTPHAWIINGTLILLASGCVVSGWHLYEGFVLHRVMLVLFGISLILMAIFNTCPIDNKYTCNFQEAFIHDYFSGTAVFLFVILSTATAMVMEEPHRRLLAVGTGMLVMILTILNCESDALAGIWQRLLFIISFGWMAYSFK
jgi:hypothetical membrane protein